jgi:hypothetical protein
VAFVALCVFVFFYCRITRPQRSVA